MTRRRLLQLGLAGTGTLVAAGAGLEQLVSHGVLPGRHLLDVITGACDVPAPPLEFSPLGPSVSGSFYSHRRRTQVGYTIAWPPGHESGDELPLIVMLHGFGGNHANALSSLTPAQAVALRSGGKPLRPMAIVTVDGGGGYWHPHPGDDPMGMVVDELIPRCRRLGLGRPPHGIGAMGISMGAYGALLLAEKYPRLFAAVAAISPAVWTTYAQAHAANPGAYTSAAEFAANDVIARTHALAGKPVRVASGSDDPFHPGVVALVEALPPGAVVDLTAGCHTGPFFLSQEPASLAFMAQHLR